LDIFVRYLSICYYIFVYKVSIESDSLCAGADDDMMLVSALWPGISLWFVIMHYVSFVMCLCVCVGGGYD